jgi:hypothetical protein
MINEKRKLYAAYGSNLCLEQIESFIKLARHYRYVKYITSDVVRDLIERIELTEKDTPQGRKKKVYIYFKYVGLLTNKGRWF